MAGQEVQGMLIRLEATTAQLRQEMAKADSSVAQVSGRIDRQLSQVDSAFDRVGLSAQRMGGILKGALAIGIGGSGKRGNNITDEAQGANLRQVGDLAIVDCIGQTTAQLADTVGQIRCDRKRINQVCIRVDAEQICVLHPKRAGLELWELHCLLGGAIFGCKRSSSTER